MPTRDEVQALLEKVRSATRGNQEIDVEILCAFPPFGFDWKPDARWQSRATFKHAIGDADGRTAPSYTYSIDAIVALIEKESPGLVIKSTKIGDGSGFWQVSEAWTQDIEVVNDFHPMDPRPPALALCEVFLTAKIAEAS